MPTGVGYKGKEKGGRVIPGARDLCGLGLGGLWELGSPVSPAHAAQNLGQNLYFRHVLHLLLGSPFSQDIHSIW